jgi:hypothetical protein
MVMNDADVPNTGKRQPPASTRFRKGQSGNPRGRPKDSKRQAPYHTVLSQKVTVREEGVSRQMTAAEAFLLHVTRSGLEGDGAAARAAMAAIEEARVRRGPPDADLSRVILLQSTLPGAVSDALIGLRGVVKLDPCRPTARLAIEPWLVEMALDRLGDRHLTFSEQQAVWKAARAPWKVKWPTWWEYKA